MKRIIVTVLACILFPAMAMGSGYAGHFGDMDGNGDGLVVWEEFQAFFPHADEEVFGQAAGEDLSLDHGEWHGFKQAHGYGHGREDGAGHGMSHTQ